LTMSGRSNRSRPYPSLVERQGGLRGGVSNRAVNLSNWADHLTGRFIKSSDTESDRT